MSTVDSLEFEKDLKSLVPKKFDFLAILDDDKDVPHALPSRVNWELQKKLLKIVEKHINKYGRIYRDDLDIYICEVILIFDAIKRKYMKHVNEESFIPFEKLYDGLFAWITHKAFPNDYIHTPISVN